MNSSNLIREGRQKSNSLQILKRRTTEAGNYVRAITQKANVPTKKFLIYGQGRTGSELLCNLLDLHPQVHCDTEILFHHAFFPKLLIDGKCTACQKDVYGFKVKLYQLQDDQKLEPRQFLFDMLDNGWKIIHLRRDNILRQVVSLIAARQRNSFHIKSKTKKTNSKKIEVDCHKILKEISQREAYQEEDFKVLKELPYLTVVYENDLLREQDHQRTVDRIFEYLDIHSVPVQSNFVRLTPNYLSDLVENYDELVGVISQSKYAHFLTNESNASPHTAI